jgi:metal-responsive CopG/Arc/MetJ family transcriptional regulator
VVVKVNVSFSEGLLKEIDDAAGEANTSRSAFLAEAAEHFLAEKEKARLIKQRTEAAERIVKLAEKIGPWNATAEVLKWRDRH